MCPRSLVPMTSVKYERDTHQLTRVIKSLKTGVKQRIEEIVWTSTPGLIADNMD